MVDWLARRAGGVIDYRLPDDPPDIPSHVLRQRTQEYLQQYHAQFLALPIETASKKITGDLFADF